MNRKTIFQIISTICLFILGSIIGFLVGTSLGGNYLSGFELWGLKGYEAVGWIGIIIGGLLGALLGITSRFLVSDKKRLK